MKKLLALVIAAGLCAGLCGCASTVSVSGAQIDADGHLIPSISDGSEPDAGLPGEKGENGEQGYDGGSGTRVTSAEDIKKAIEQTAEGGTAEISLANDLILSEPLKITADTVIHGNGYKVKLDSDIKNPIFNGGKNNLTLDNITLDGQNNRVYDYFGAINGGEGSSLTLSNVTIENVEAERIIRAVSVQSVNLTNVTIRNNKTSNSKDGAYGLLFTNVENMTLKNVSITDNNIGKSLIMVWDNDMIWGNDKVNALTAESLTIENNTIGEHILATSGTNCSDTITLTSGSIKGNNTAGIYMVGNLTIGKDMNVQCGITLNNDSAKGVCTLTNDDTITGDITSANWAARDRGLPNYTGTGTHTGTKTNITDLTAPVQP